MEYPPNKFIKEESRMMFERMDYIVERIDGDYAYLKNQTNPDAELKCVAMALLPPEIVDGSHVIYEMLEYRIEK